MVLFICFSIAEHDKTLDDVCVVHILVLLLEDWGSFPHIESKTGESILYCHIVNLISPMLLPCTYYYSSKAIKSTDKLISSIAFFRLSVFMKRNHPTPPD